MLRRDGALGNKLVGADVGGCGRPGVALDIGLRRIGASRLVDARRDTIMTNNVRYVVTWWKKADDTALAGKPARLKFAMRSAKL